MATIIRNSRIVEDNWLRHEETPDGALAALPDGPVIVSFAAWQRHRSLIEAHQGPRGVLLLVDTPLDQIAPDLAGFALVAVHIPKFGDGRGLSLARLLRERYGYGGELRAVGEVLHDQLADMKRCGFDSFQLRADQDLQAALEAFAPFSEAYQASVDRPQPLFRRRTA